MAFALFYMFRFTIFLSTSYYLFTFGAAASQSLSDIAEGTCGGNYVKCQDCSLILQCNNFMLPLQLYYRYQGPSLQRLHRIGAGLFILFVILFLSYCVCVFFSSVHRVYAFSSSVQFPFSSFFHILIIQTRSLFYLFG